MSMISAINYSLDINQIEAIQNIVNHNDTIINPTLIYSICKPASHLVYYIKELYEYINKVSEVDLRRLYIYRRLVDEKKLCEKLKK
mgnify:CR=1 FL=1